MSDEIVKEEQSTQRARRGVGAGLILLVIILAAGIWGSNRFVERERARELQDWQVRLGIIADSRAAAADAWIQDQFRLVEGLSGNPSLQLYMTELNLLRTSGGVASDATNPAEREYLENLLVVTAQQGGFMPGADAPSIAANVDLPAASGLALADANGRPLATTPRMPEISARYRAAMAQAATGQSLLIDLFETNDGTNAIGFVLPIFAIQAEEGTDTAIGYVIAQRVAGADLYATLQQPGDTLNSAETLLVRQSGNQVDYLSPRAGDRENLSASIALDTDGSAAVFAVTTPGGFTEARDYRGNDVLVAARAVPSAPWVVMRKVDVAEALSASDTRLKTLQIVFVLITAGVALALIAVWRHATSLKAERAASQYRDAVVRLERSTQFLERVTDGHPARIAALDAEGRYTFANRAIADDVGLAKDELHGKSLASVLGPVRAKQLEEVNREATISEKAIRRILTFDEEGQRRIVQSYHAPLSDEETRMLMIQEDITDAVEDRERRESVLRQLVTTLVQLIDQRDPFAAFQSERVAAVATAIAREMDGDDALVRTCDIAGNLVNIGKFFVPADLLTKSGTLDDDERLMVRESLLKGADLLDGLDFDVPVADAIRDLQEHWDGSGYPASKSGEEITLAARIITIANAFVGMVSPRAWREPLSVDEAILALNADADRFFDRKPLSALVNYLDNRGGREAWQDFSDTPAPQA